MVWIVIILPEEEGSPWIFTGRDDVRFAAVDEGVGGDDVHEEVGDLRKVGLIVFHNDDGDVPGKESGEDVDVGRRIAGGIEDTGMAEPRHLSGLWDFRKVA